MGEKMIKDKLKELSKYIEEIDEIKPIGLLESNIRKIEKDLQNLPREQLDLGDKFSKDILKQVNEYKKKELFNSVITCELYNILIGLIRKSMVEAQAELLGIDRKMYKEEMRLLFKGKKT